MCELLSCNKPTCWLPAQVGVACWRFFGACGLILLMPLLQDVLLFWAKMAKSDRPKMNATKVCWTASYHNLPWLARMHIEKVSKFSHVFSQFQRESSQIYTQVNMTNSTWTCRKFAPFQMALCPLESISEDTLFQISIRQWLHSQINRYQMIPEHADNNIDAVLLAIRPSYRNQW